MRPTAVIVPLYKQIPNEAEIKSLNQCIRILLKHPIVFFCGKNFDSNYYEKFCEGKINFRIERFENNYFESINCYNKLMLSRHFYQKFINYEYIFIYQLDAFIFRDELDYWCSLGYDIIGAPWFKGFDKPEEPLVFLGSGNGGCTLRKIKSCLRVLTRFSYVENPFKLFLQEKSFFNLLKNLTIQNNFHYKFNNYELNEDYFFSYEAAKKFKWFKICPPEKSLEFSFETAPSYLFKLNKNKLPMCCHAWGKYEYDFWKPFIDLFQ
jgi:hypothetical protein